MAKAIVCVGDTGLSGTTPFVSYSVTVISSTPFSKGSAYNVDTTISLSANLTAWRNQIIALAAESGVTLTSTDVIIFGVPS